MSLLQIRLYAGYTHDIRIRGRGGIKVAQDDELLNFSSLVALGVNSIANLRPEVLSEGRVCDSACGRNDKPAP